MRQKLSPADVSYDEEAQPKHPNHDPRSERHRAYGFCEIRCVEYYPTIVFLDNILIVLEY